MNGIIFKYEGNRYEAPTIKLNAKTLWAALLLAVSGGRIKTKTARAIIAERNKAWKAHAEKIQMELDNNKR